MAEQSRLHITVDARSSKKSKKVNGDAEPGSQMAYRRYLDICYKLRLYMGVSRYFDILAFMSVKAIFKNNNECTIVFQLMN